MRHIQCISPVDGRVYVDRPTATEAEIKATLERARAAQKAWRHVPLSERAALIVRVVDALKGMGAEIAEELARQMGRPIRYGQGELRGVEERARYMAEVAPMALAPVVPIDTRPGVERYVAREPVGLVFTIAPWNYPYLTTVNSVVPALIAGNAVLLKQAAQTLLVGDRFQKAFDSSVCPRACSPTSSWITARPKPSSRAAMSIMSLSPDRSRRAARSSARRPEPSRRSGSSSAEKILLMWRRTPI